MAPKVKNSFKKSFRKPIFEKDTEKLQKEDVKLGDEKVYVAVSRNVKENWAILKWALQNSGGKKVCTIHVHQPPNKMSTPKKEVEKEWGEMLSVIHECLCISQISGEIETRYIEADSIEKGIIQLVELHSITELVIGAAAEKHYSRLMTVMSKKAVYVRDKAPHFCHIWFICNGTLIHTRRAINPQEESRGKDAHEASESDGEAESPTGSCDKSISCWSSDSFDSSVSRSESGREFAASRLYQSSSMHNESESTINDHLYDKHEHAMVEAEKSRRLAFKDRLRLRKYEKEALDDAIFKVERAEKLYLDELRQRKETERALATGMHQLEMINNERLSLETLFMKSNLSLKDLEENYNKECIRLLMDRNIALEEAKKVREQFEELEIQKNNALQETDNLRRFHQGESSSHVAVSISTFPYSDLETATNSFDPLLKIGEGAFGSIYKGRLHHTEVAIKILNPNGSQGSQEFYQEVDVLSKVRHPNVITLIGTCPEKHALIYEYLPGGNLEDRLNCKNNALPLPWQTRVRIATDLCTALIFLHSSRPGRIIHGDLKPGNVLLDEHDVCKLSDFGICRVVLKNGILVNQTTMIVTEQIRGTVPYIAPEVFSTGELTPKTDVYSFGIILLRLLTAKPAMRIAQDVGTALDDGTFASILDPTAGDWPYCQAVMLAHLALSCCNVDRKIRPNLEPHAWNVLGPMLDSCRKLTISRRVSDNLTPSYFMCPIFHVIMTDPHIASDGFTYELGAITGWLDGGNDTSPMTNVTLDDHNLTPNRALRSSIQEWLQYNRI